MNMHLRPGDLSATWQSLPQLASSTAMMALPKAQTRTWLEIVALSSRRAQAYMAIPTELAACRSPQDVMSAQARFWETAFAQYNQSARAIADIWTGLMPSAAAQPRSATPVPAQRDLITFPDPAPQRGGREAA